MFGGFVWMGVVISTLEDVAIWHKALWIDAFAVALWILYQIPKLCLMYVYIYHPNKKQIELSIDNVESLLEAASADSAPPE